MKRCILLILSLLIISCATPRDDINELKKPIKLIGKSADEVILMGSCGRIIYITQYKWMHRSINECYEVGDIIAKDFTN